MASITLDAVWKRHPGGAAPAVADVSLAIGDGERLAIVGPSGSGKSTLLRIIAGLDTPSSGRVRLDGVDVTDVAPEARDLAMVFQSYALYPHLRVRENLAFPLRMRGLAPAAISARVATVAAALGLTDLLDRRPAALSGGERQRVALGRAMVRDPRAFLFDEPLSNLDPRRRADARAGLVALHARLGATMVYVTHDQEEAFILSDAIAVMAQGSILQYAAPAELYFRPNSRFVAEFLGEANFIAVSGLERAAGGGFAAMTAYGAIPVTDDRVDPRAQTELVAVLRPEEVVLTDDGTASDGHVPPIAVEIVKELFLGSRCLVTVRAPDGEEILVECAKAQVPASDRPAWIKWKLNAAVLVDR